MTSLTLRCRAPFAWNELISFLAPRAIPGVEVISGGGYRRSVGLDNRFGRIEVRPNRSFRTLSLAIDLPDSTAPPQIATRVRTLFDLDTDPEPIASSLGSDALLAPLVARLPGLRLPGAWDGFELAIRAILGQQVTVRGATTLCGRVVEEYGREVPGGFLFPKPSKLARARFTTVGIPKARATALRALAGACASGELDLAPGVDSAQTRALLQRLPGIGDWTAQYIAMRALGDADAFPSGDLGLLQAAARLLGCDPKSMRPADLPSLAEAWRPYRAYAAMHLWHSLA